MQLCMESGSTNMPNGHPTLSHAQVTHTWSKWDEYGIFGKVRSRGTTFMLKSFSFEAWIMMNFEMDVWRNQT